MNRNIFDLCKNGKSGELLLAIQNGADINTPNADGYTPLSWACCFGSVNCVEVLISEGADVNRKHNGNLTPLHIAACGSDGSGSFARKSKCLELLIASGAHLNERDLNGDTPLHLAAYYNSGVTMKALIESGADATILNNGHLFWEEIRDASLKNEMREFLLSWEFPMKEPAE